MPTNDRRNIDALPPDLTYDGSAAAADVFCHSYFGADDDDDDEEEAARRRMLWGRSTVDDVFRRSFERSADCERWLDGAADALSDEANLDYCRVRRYYASSAIATKQMHLAVPLRACFGCDFREAALPIADVLRSLRPLLQPDEGNNDGDDEAQRVLDLSLLDPFKEEEEDEETFLVADKLYVRDPMRRVFGLFVEDATPCSSNENDENDGDENDPAAAACRRWKKKEDRAALCGASGVGKSLLFFLAALHRATTARVAYYRRRTRDDRVSFFFMEPQQDDGTADGTGTAGTTSVRVWFTRNVDTYSLQENGGLRGFSCRVLEGLDLRRHDDEGTPCTFLDGPRMQDEAEEHCGPYNYICSNGPRFWKEWHHETRLWILDGWSEADAGAALRALGHTPASAAAAFDLCGGNIRDMVRSTANYGKVKATLDRIISGLDKDAVELVVTSSHRPGDPRNHDKIRNMFEQPDKKRRGTGGGTGGGTGDGGDGWKRLMHCYQVVDSPYVLRRMYGALGLGRFLHAHGRVRWIEHDAILRAWYARVVHRWAEAAMSDPQVESFNEVCWSAGSREECVRSMTKPNVYWIPSDPNYPNVDAALVVGTALYVFHTGMQQTSVFDEDELQTTFVSVVARQLVLERVVVCFVHRWDCRYRCHDPAMFPSQPQLQLPPQDSPRALKRCRASIERRGSDAGLPSSSPAPLPVAYGRYEVAATEPESDSSCSESLKALFRGLDTAITFF